MKTLKEFLNEGNGFSASDLKILKQSKIKFDTDIPNLAMAFFGDYNIVINRYKEGSYEATVGQGPMERTVLNIEGKSLKAIVKQVESKTK